MGMGRQLCRLGSSVLHRVQRLRSDKVRPGSRMFSLSTTHNKGLVDMLKDGGTVVIAEGYLWEIERRGYLQFGQFLPNVVLDKPAVLRQLHEEFVHAGTDVVEAFTYYGHRENMRLRGREDEVEKLNRSALQIARDVADDHGKLMAGNLSNNALYDSSRPDIQEQVYQMMKEQVEWAVDGGADYIIGETFNSFGEAMLALKAIQEFGKGLPAVVTLTAYYPDRTTDEVPIPEACKRLEEAGATVVGLNCARGPQIMMPLIEQIIQMCTIPIAALPVPYRTTEKHKTFFSVEDPVTGKRVYPADLDTVRCTRSEIRQFAEDAKKAGVQYVGLCCGNSPSLMREVAEVYGRNPPASKYKPAVEKSMIFGDPSGSYSDDVRKLAKWMTGDF